MSELAEKTLQGLQGTVRFAHEGMSIFQSIQKLIQNKELNEDNEEGEVSHQEGAVSHQGGEISINEFFEKNSDIRLDSFIRNANDAKEFNILKQCLNSSKVQYAMQDLGNDSYKIFFRADDVTRIDYALGEFSKKMDELYQNQNKDNKNHEQFYNENEHESHTEKEVGKSAEKTEESITDDAEMCIEKAFEAATKEAIAHNAEIDAVLSQSKQRDISL